MGTALMIAVGVVLVLLLAAYLVLTTALTISRSSSRPWMPRRSFNSIYSNHPIGWSMLLVGRFLGVKAEELRPWAAAELRECPYKLRDETVDLAIQIIQLQNSPSNLVAFNGELN